MHYHIWLPVVRFSGNGRSRVDAEMQPEAYKFRTQAYRQRNRIIEQGEHEPTFIQVRSCELVFCAPEAAQGITG